MVRTFDEGSVKARDVAQKTMGRVREAVFGWDEKRAEVAQKRKPSLQNMEAGNRWKARPTTFIWKTY